MHEDRLRSAAPSIAFFILILYYASYVKGDVVCTWWSGNDVANAKSTTDEPGGRSWTANWQTHDGLYIFGGYGVDSTGQLGVLSDLYKWDLTFGSGWQLLSGSQLVNSRGVYGTLGVASNTRPGGRFGAAFWQSKDGMTLYMFGGYGSDNSSAIGELSDMWEYSLLSNTWTWIAGSPSVNTLGVHSAIGGYPGGRHFAASWPDPNSNLLYLFAGTGYDSTNTSSKLDERAYLNDLWSFDPAQVKWTWISGSSIANQNNTTDFPGGRHSVLAIPNAYGVTLVGGFGLDTVGARGVLDDIWLFEGSSFIFQAGNEQIQQPATYSNTSSARGGQYGAVGWNISNNEFLFGGYGVQQNATTTALSNDFWELTGTTWDWIDGSQVLAVRGFYGDFQVRSTASWPGSRAFSAGWAVNMTLYLFGGYGYDSKGTIGQLNDLWIMQFDNDTLPRHDSTTGVYFSTTFRGTTGTTGHRPDPTTSEKGTDKTESSDESGFQKGVVIVVVLLTGLVFLAGVALVIVLLRRRMKARAAFDTELVESTNGQTPPSTEPGKFVILDEEEVRDRNITNEIATMIGAKPFRYEELAQKEGATVEPKKDNTLQ